MKNRSPELRVTLNYINMMRKTLSDLRRVEQTVNGFVNATPLREIYRGLRSSKAHTSATDILVHTENISKEILELKRALLDGEAILKQQAQYYEQQQKSSS